MENIGTAGESLGQHSNYNCDIGLASAHHHRHQQVINHQLSLQEREKSFSVTHLLDLPGHLYHEPHSGEGLEHQQRLSQSIKPHEGNQMSTGTEIHVDLDPRIIFN